MDAFEQKLSALMVKEVFDAQGDSAAMSKIIAGLASAVGTTVAIFAKADAGKIERILTGLEMHILSTAIEKADRIRGLENG